VTLINAGESSPHGSGIRLNLNRAFGHTTPCRECSYRNGDEHPYCTNCGVENNHYDGDYAVEAIGSVENLRESVARNHADCLAGHSEAKSYLAETPLTGADQAFMRHCWLCGERLIQPDEAVCIAFWIYGMIHDVNNICERDDHSHICKQCSDRGDCDAKHCEACGALNGEHDGVAFGAYADRMTAQGCGLEGWKETLDKDCASGHVGLLYAVRYHATSQHWRDYMVRHGHCHWCGAKAVPEDLPVTPLEDRNPQWV
jgi:hypothetical protein